MICSCLSTVVYAPSRSMAWATSRTVLGPRDHSTWRIASSATVGVLHSLMVPILYDDVRRCQYECYRRSGPTRAPQPKLALWVARHGLKYSMPSSDSRGRY